MIVRQRGTNSEVAWVVLYLVTVFLGHNTEILFHSFVKFLGQRTKSAQSATFLIRQLHVDLHLEFLQHLSSQYAHTHRKSQ